MESFPRIDIIPGAKAARAVLHLLLDQFRHGGISDHHGAAATLDSELYDPPFPQPEGRVWTPDWAAKLREEDALRATPLMREWGMDRWAETVDD